MKNRVNNRIYRSLEILKISAENFKIRLIKQLTIKLHQNKQMIIKIYNFN